MTPLTPAAFDRWLAAYGQASAADDPLASARLFSQDASYHESPFDRAAGRAAGHLRLLGHGRAESGRQKLDLRNPGRARGSGHRPLAFPFCGQGHRRGGGFGLYLSGRIRRRGAVLPLPRVVAQPTRRPYPRGDPMMRIVEYDAVDPLQVLHLNLLCLDFALTPELVAIIRRMDPRPFPFFALYTVEGSGVAGQVGVFRLPVVSTAGAAEVGGVWAVSTHPAWRGKGVASLLLDEAHARMAAAGLRFSTLGTDSYRVAHGLYEKQGYRDVFSPAAALGRSDALPRPSSLTAEAGRRRAVGSGRPPVRADRPRSPGLCPPPYALLPLPARAQLSERRRPVAVPARRGGGRLRGRRPAQRSAAGEESAAGRGRGRGGGSRQPGPAAPTPATAKSGWMRPPHAPPSPRPVSGSQARAGGRSWPSPWPPTPRSPSSAVATGWTMGGFCRRIWI